MNFNKKIIFKILGIIGIIISIALIIPLTFSLFTEDKIIFESYIITLSATLLISSVFIFFGQGHSTNIKPRDGFLIVSLSWIFASFIGCIPYILSGFSDSFIDAFFESTSAFTTTNATVFELDKMPSSLVLWRSICNWLGGMGIIILILSILPNLGIGGNSLAKTEIPGASLNKFSTSPTSFAKSLYLFYILFTLVEFTLLVIGPMGFFESIINSLSGISTSGLPNTKYSYYFRNDLYSQIIISIFAILASVNFTAFYFVKTRNWKKIFSNLELKVFFGILLFSCIINSVILYFSKIYTFTDSLRYGFVETISISTTSGFYLSDLNLWPSTVLSILTILTIIGGCSFSTSGSMKVVRFLVLFKLVVRGFSRRLHPRSVVAVKLGNKVISAQKVSYTTVFILVFFVTIVGGAFILSLQNLDLLTTLSSSISMVSNTGIGVGDISSGNFSIYSKPLRVVLTFLMLAGRLEFFSLFLLFFPTFWNPTKNKNAV